MKSHDYRLAAEIRRRHKQGDKLPFLCNDYDLSLDVLIAVVQCHCIEGAAKVLKEFRQSVKAIAPP